MGGGGGILFSEVEDHMQKLSSFGRGKKFGLKSHLRGPSTALQLFLEQPISFSYLTKVLHKVLDEFT